ncbi:MAG TPA: UDP-N-acetylmuramoyl-tripeptide--D-alanyl-D-alanine ligase [Terriglobales bacterium]
MKLSLQEIANALNASGKFEGEAVAENYSIDSRAVNAGDLFFAIKGERYDAHDFVRDVIGRRAYAVVAEARAGEFGDLSGVLVVEDTLAALQALGNYVRRKWGKRVIGLTGSAGKTTTKDATALVLSRHFHVLKSQGNLNNHYGVPLQLLRLEPEHDMAVIEMGMNHAGEIAALCRIAEPDWAIITNVGVAHAGNFEDGIEGVSRAKFELVENTKPNGIIVLNADDERVRRFGERYQGSTMLYGTAEDANVRAANIRDKGALGSEFDILLQPLRVSASSTTDTTGIVAHAELPLIGAHNLLNAMAAVATGVASGIPLEECAKAIASLSPGDKRGEVLQIAGATVINDCYNSNPKALQAMIEALMKVPARRHVAVVGEMRELGDLSREMHSECGQFIAAQHVDSLLGVTGDARSLVEAAQAAGIKAEFVETPQQAGEWLSENMREGDAVLLKASRGVRLEGALEVLTSKAKT